ncbi:MAG: glycosyl transferase [Pseudolabrys sp.]
MTLSPQLSQLGIVLIGSALVSAALIAVLFPLLRRYALARPNARSSHTEPTPQGGGIAVIAATLAVSAAAVAFSAPAPPFQPLAIVFAATALMAVIGVVDDIRSMSIAPRLVAQAALVGFVLATLPSEYRLIEVLPWWLERLIFLVAGIWFVNLVNFMDGLDWMSVSEVVPVAAALALIGLAGGLPGYAIVTATALCGAMIGFAPFNRPVARLFLGDVGSLPIGLLLGWLLALLATHGHLAAAVLLPLYYLADTTVTVFRRIGRGERFWDSHRSHFYQRATDGGYTVREIVARVFAVNLVLAACAAATVQGQSRIVDLAALAVGVLVVGWLLRTFARGRR